jgi:hypothetical protein
MVNVIFIDDNYLYQNFPLPKRLDRAQLLSIIQLEQFTSIQDLLGSCLYEHMEDKVLNQTLSGSEVDLYKLLKYALAMFSAKATVSMLRTAAAGTKNEESVQDQYVIDALVSQIESKAKYINTKIIDYIKNDTDLYAITQAEGCKVDDVFQEDDVYQGSVYYPNTLYRNEENCDN